MKEDDKKQNVLDEIKSQSIPKMSATQPSYYRNKYWLRNREQHLYNIASVTDYSKPFR